MSALLTPPAPPDPLSEHGRFRRALLNALADGTAYAFEVRSRMLGRGYRAADLVAVHAHLLILEQSGLLDAKGTSLARRFSLNVAGMRERVRLGLP
jgi:hypothetical protein